MNVEQLITGLDEQWFLATALPVVILAGAIGCAVADWIRGR